MSKKNKHKTKEKPRMSNSGSPPVPPSPPPPAPPSSAAADSTTPTSSTPSSNAGRPQYEFDDAQNRVIEQLAHAIMWVRVPMFIAAVLQAVIATGLAFRLHKDGAHIVGIIGHGLAAIVCFMLASWLARAAKEFHLITVTKGSDITHLMRALRSLDAWFDTLGFFVKLYLFLLGVLIVVLLVGLIWGVFKEPG
jgi:hypothetical protein